MLKEIESTPEVAAPTSTKERMSAYTSVESE